MGIADLELTRWMRSQPGTALSREKTQDCGDVDTVVPTAAQRERA